jgi:hypothetical protein
VEEVVVVVVLVVVEEEREELAVAMGVTREEQICTCS